MVQVGFYFDQTRCTGCYTCAVACKDWNDIAAGPVNWLRVRAIEAGSFPNPFLAYLFLACYHCADPPCARACPVSAITKIDSNGIVVVDRDKCLGNKQCRSLCRNACPWDAPQFEREENARMQKCDFCRERFDRGEQAVCVESCPMHALDAGPLEQLKLKYGDSVEAAGFSYSARFKPSVLFKAKPRN